MAIVIDNIIVGPMGKIRAIKLHGVQKLVTKEDILDLVKNYPNDYRNFSINERGNFVFKGSNLTYNSNKYPIIVHEKSMMFGSYSMSRVEGFTPNDITRYNDKELDFIICKVVCEKIIIKDIMYNAILSIQFKCNTHQSIEIFKNFGVKQINNSIFELTYIQLYKLFNTSKLLNNFILDGSISQVSGSEYLVYEGNILIMEIDNSNSIKLKKWAEKAKILGIYDNYEIDFEQSKLNFISCCNENLILPPVRTLRLSFLEDIYLEELVIPDTVISIDSELGGIKGLKSITFGENLVSCSELFMEDIKGINKINFNNISRLYIRRCFSNLYEAQLKLSTRVINGGLFTTSTDVFVELIED